MARRVPQTARARRRSSSEKRDEQYALLLESIQLAAEVVEKLADGALNVPGLKSAAGLAVQIVKMAKAVKRNQKDCDDLVEKVCDLFRVIAEELHGGGKVFVDQRLHLRLQAFQRELIRVKLLVELLASRRYITRFLFHTSDKRDIDACKEKLANAFQELQLGHMIRCEEGLTYISGNVLAISTNVHSMARSQEAYARQTQLDIAQLDRGRRDDNVGIMYLLNDLAMRISNTVGFKTRQCIRLMSPARILWHHWATDDAEELNRTMPCYKNDAMTWVEAKMVMRILRDYPTASRAIVSGWDFASHDEHMLSDVIKFYIHIEYHDKRRRKRYVLIELHATGLEGKHGPTISLDDNAELVREEMDEIDDKLAYLSEYADSDSDSDTMTMPSPTSLEAGCACLPPWMI